MAVTTNVLVGVAEIVVTSIVGGPLTSPKTVGYTADGAILTIRSSFADIKVEENIGTIKRKLIDQEIQVTLNMAEGDLDSLVMAIPGSIRVLDVITLGGSPLQEYSVLLTVPKPGGGNRLITLDLVNPTGEVSIPFKKGEVSIVPITFACIVADNSKFGTIADV